MTLSGQAHKSHCRSRAYVALHHNKSGVISARYPGRALVDADNAPAFRETFQHGEREILDREVQGGARAGAGGMGQGGADGAAMADGHDVLPRVVAGQALEGFADAGDDGFHALAAWGRFGGAQRPEGVRRLGEAGGQFGMGQALPFAQILFDQAGLDRGFGKRIAGLLNGGGGANRAGQGGDAGSVSRARDNRAARPNRKRDNKLPRRRCAARSRASENSRM